MVDKFNKYFVNVASDLNDQKYNNLNPNQSLDFKQFLKNKVSSSIFLTSIEQVEIYNIIKDLFRLIKTHSI